MTAAPARTYPAGTQPVAVVSIGPASSPSTWSGIPNSIVRTLQGLGREVLDVSPLPIPRARVRHSAWRLARSFGRDYRYEYAPAVQRGFAAEVDRALESGARPTAAVAMSCPAIAATSTGVPLGLWTDATIDNLLKTYPEFRAMSTRRRRRALDVERATLQRCAFAVYASTWAARSAVETLGAPPNRVHVIPFGANVEAPQDFDLDAVIDARMTTGVCRLLWIGSSWSRKRGRFAVDVSTSLARRGVDVELVMAGEAPDDGMPLPLHVRHLGFLDRESPTGRTAYDLALSEACFTLLPSRAEAFGISVAEGNAYGVPCIASRVGGLADAVRDGRNGMLVDPEMYADDVADVVEAAWTHDAYPPLARNSRGEYRTRLNWSSSCRRLLDVIGKAT